MRFRFCKSGFHADVEGISILGQYDVYLIDIVDHASYERIVGRESECGISF